MQAETIRRIRPHYSDRYLANPHKGCCTFQHFNGDALYPGTWWSEEGPTEFPVPADPVMHRRTTDWSRWESVVRGYLPSTVAYCRWFWRLSEPREGEYDFSTTEKAPEAAQRQGQSLAVRLMAYGSHQARVSGALLRQRGGIFRGNAVADERHRPRRIPPQG